MNDIQITQFYHNVFEENLFIFTDMIIEAGICILFLAFHIMKKKFGKITIKSIRGLSESIAWREYTRL